MSFTRVRAPGMWTLASVFDPGEIETIDQNLSRCVDGYAGGSCAPSSPIEIGGDGLKVTTVFLCTSSATFTVACAATFDDGVAVNGALVASGDITSFGGLVGDTVTTTGNAAIGGNLTCVAATCASVNALALTCAAGTCTGVFGFTGSGRLRPRLAAGADSNTTYGVSSADIVVTGIAGHSDITGDRVYTLSTAGAGDGDKIEFRNYDSTNKITISGYGEIRAASGKYCLRSFIFIDGAWYVYASVPFDA